MSTAKEVISERAKAALKKATKDDTLIGLNQNQIEAVLEPYANAISNALPSGQNPNRLIQMAAFIISGDDKLKECTPRSIIGCVLRTAILGLNPALRECYYIPRRRNIAPKDQPPKFIVEATFQDDYSGLMALVRRSGQIKSAFAEVVREGDEFSFQRGTSPQIIHRPPLDSDSRKIAVYAVLEYLNGGIEFIVMSPSQVNKHRLKNPQQGPGGSTGIWLEWEDSMWKKTALRQILKTAPKSTDLSMALTTDNAVLYPESFNAGQVDPNRVFHADEQGTVPEAEPAQLPSGEQSQALEMPPIFAEALTLPDLETAWAETNPFDMPDLEGAYLARKAQLMKAAKTAEK